MISVTELFGTTLEQYAKTVSGIPASIDGLIIAHR